MRLASYISQRFLCTDARVIATACALVLVIGYFDYSTGPDVSFGIFYLVPICLVAWLQARRVAVVTACACAAVWLVVDRLTNHHAPVTAAYWNMCVRLGFFLLITLLLNHLRFLASNLEARVKERTADLATEVERRKQAEEVVRESEEQFRQLAENINEVFWMSDVAKKEIIYVSPGYNEIWGRSRESLYASPRNWLDAIHPDDRDRVFHAALTKQVSGEYAEEYRIIRPDASMRWIQDRAFPVHDGFGNVYRIVGIAEDITQRKQAENQRTVFGGLAHTLSAVAQPEEAARIIMDAASKLFGWDAGYLHLYSPAEDRIIPLLTVDTVNGQLMDVPTSSFTMDPSPLMRRVIDTGAQLINRETDSPTVPLVPFGDTGRPSASMMYVPIHRNGAVLGVLSIQSYTPHAYSQNDLISLQTLADRCGDAMHRIELAAAARELASIVENSADAITSKTLDGIIISWNKGAERLYGYTAEEIKGRSISILVPPNHEDDMRGIMARIAHGEPAVNCETTRLRKDGTQIEVALNVSPTRDDSGRINGLSVIARDVTERKRLEREIAGISQHEQQRLAHELHDRLGSYLAGVAFRVKTLAERLRQRGVPEADEAIHLVNLVNEGTNQVRNFAHLLSPVEIAEGGIAVGLSRLGAEMETLFGITCQVNVAPDLPLLTDEQGLQLYRIAQEAARNAVQHGKARNVEISVHHEPRLLIQSIRNDGQAWNRPKQSKNGLGLRIMRYRAGILGGTLAVQSDPDGQTAVVCQVPLRSTALPQTIPAPAS